ncbi:hypothetical protein SKAU_G00267200 [Synaphobranchus kaupii]|uniref:Uncharacterized protein n=1 Tax=Synaphobranchus kaupii TaxID=118154 RepID=A0A9Q1EZV3_SYNKA|nr:hypothetical protein SKAU_G00267200 [Synaphobranchus kaupii]
MVQVWQGCAAGPTLASEALDVEVDALHTDHLALADLPAAEAVDGGGARARASPPATIGAVLVGYCWRKGQRLSDIFNRISQSITVTHILLRQGDSFLSPVVDMSLWS